MPRRTPKLPSVTSPPSMFLVRWVDAVHDNTHDGPTDDAGGIESVPCLGFHVRTARDKDHGRFMVMAMQAYRDKEGTNCSRFELSIPVSMIREVIPVSLSPEIDTSGLKIRPGRIISVDGPLSQVLQSDQGVTP